jgi:ketosteroid isomerase-like protein
MATFYAPDVDIVSPTAELFGRSYRGHEGLRDYVQDFVDAFEPVQLDLEEIVDGGEQGVVCVIRIRARGAQSGAEVRYCNASVITVRDGLIRREVVYTNPAEALEAVGLSE